MREASKATTDQPSCPRCAGTRKTRSFSSCVARCLVLGLVILLVPFATQISLAGIAPESKTPRQPGALILDDAPLPLKANKPRTEAERDHLEAVAQFAAGAMHEHRGELAEALQCYQRAFRCDPQSTSVLREVISCAVRLKRYAEAVRYALKAVELQDADPILLRGLGGYLSEEGDWAKAVSLYEKAVAARGKKREVASDILVQMEMGRLYYLLEKPKEASACFARVLYAIDHPDEFMLEQDVVKILLSKPGMTYQLMGECFLTADKLAEAKTVFERADKVAPDKALRDYNQARLALKNNKPDEALGLLDAAFAQHLTDQGMAPYDTLADVLNRLGKKTELLDRLEKLNVKFPEDASLGYYLAGQYRAAGKLDKAEALYLAMLKQKATLTGYRSLAELTRQTKRYDVLIRVLGEAMEKAGVLDILGAEAQAISNDAEAMRAILEYARNEVKKSPEPFGNGQRLAVAILALEAKQYDAASEFFNLALAVKDAKKAEKPNAKAVLSDSQPSRAAEVLITWGVGLLLGERYAESAKVFQRGIDDKVLPDDNPAFYFYLAGALALDSHADEALAAARIAGDKKKDSARFRGRAAWVLYMTKRHDEAIKAYRELIRQFDGDHASVENRDVLREARTALSSLLVQKNEMTPAEECLESVLDEFPDDAGALNDLGYLWADQNKHLERAERMIRKAVVAEPDNKAYRDSLGWALFRLGKYDQAVAELEKAIDEKKPDGVVFDHLGDAYQKLGKRDKAVEAWNKAVAILRKEKENDKAAAIDKKLKDSK
jgi:tetratricopeptide (TPR) repeat protein